MSDFLSVAAVTQTLQQMLAQRMPAFKSAVDPLATAVVTARVPSKAREGISEAHYSLNLYLYQTELNAAWRNRDLPPVKPGESGQPPLAVNLHYLLSAYGPTDEIDVQKLLGFGMSILHDYAVLNPATLQSYAEFSNLHSQVERIRISPLGMSLEEISKLWTVFQAPYQISAIYQVSVVLIESTRTRTAPLPVLSIGPGNRGIVSQPSLTPPYATLENVSPANGQPALALFDEAARQSNQLTLSGHHLSGKAVAARVRNRYQPDSPFPYTLESSSATRLVIALTAAEDGPWPAGMYSVEVEVTLPTTTQVSNTLPFLIAPQATTIEAAPADEGWTVALGSALLIYPEQTVSLLLDGYEFPAPSPRETATRQVDFTVSGIPAGVYRVRLRVDGVDSLLVDRTVSPPVFRTESSEEVFQVELP